MTMLFLQLKLQKVQKILNVTEKGYGKRTSAEDFNVQYRGGKGVKNTSADRKKQDF